MLLHAQSHREHSLIVSPCGLAKPLNKILERPIFLILYGKGAFTGETLREMTVTEDSLLFQRVPERSRAPRP